MRLIGDVADSARAIGEHSLHTGGVTGSIPVAPTMSIALKYLNFS
jgi:hypothetical protein